jgi:DNA invertase Pin-like site-specific DNA recombinase
MLTIMAAFAQMERDTMIELTRAGLAAAAANNRHGRRARKVEDAAAARARTSKVKRSVPRTLEISLESPSLLSTGTFSRRAGRQSLRARRRSHLFHMRDSWVIPTGLLRRLSRCRRIVRSGR